MTTATEPRRTLLDISADLTAISDLLTESGGDITDPQVAESVEAWFKEIESDEAEKVGNYIGLIREKELRASAMKAEAERYALHAKHLENSAKALKDRLHFYMDLHGKKKIETPRGNASVCGNGGKPPLRIDPAINPEEVPPIFQRVTISIDNEKVREAIAGGQDVPWATIEASGSHLRIK